MDNLDLLVKSLNRIENNTLLYIYKKYIEIDETPETPETSETPDPTLPQSQPILSNNLKYSKKPLNKEEYKLFKDRIFDKERKSIITQDEVLKKDLEDMTIADEEYEKKPNLFNRKKYHSYPDEKRCTYIRKIKHKLMRCKNGILNDDEDVCSKHEDTPNIYWDMYNDLLEKV
jgi:hypothetical protein